MEPRQLKKQLFVAARVVHSHSLHLEFLEVGATFLSRRSHDIQEVWGKHKGNPLLTDSHETLVVAQDVAKVDVEEVSCRNTKGFMCFVRVRSHSLFYFSIFLFQTTA